MTPRSILFGFTIYLLAIVCRGQVLKLKIDPQFEFVNEDWTVGRALPSMSVCVQYTGARPLTMAINSGDPFGYFRLSPINETCWSLILQKALDADIVNPDGSRGQSFSLAFRCTDGKIQAFGNADVQVVDINDNPPRFVDTKTAISVPEDAEIGKSILTVSTFDPDTGVGGIDGFLLEDDFKGVFRIRNGTCFDSHCTADVILNDKLNYDIKNVYTLTVVAFDGAGRSKVVNEARFPVVLTVLDVENSPPKFVVDSRVHHVPEDAPVGSNIFQVYAYDGDVGVPRPRSILYSLAEPNEYFGINSTSGWVFVKKALDRESPDILRSNGAVNLVIVAEENAPSSEIRPSASINATVIITDIDDEPPRCNLTRYAAQILENSQRFVPITLTNAVDLYVYDNDEATNGEFQVSLLDDEGVFDVTPKIVYNVGNLLIRVLNSSAIDYENRQLFQFKVVLTPTTASNSKTSPRTYCDVTVAVLDTNDNTPQFNKSFMDARVSENQPVGTPVTHIGVYDVDTPQYLPIVLKLSGVGSELFQIDPKDSTLKTAAVLDREKRSDYQLTVTAIDENGKGNSNSASMRIEIGDVNDNAPEFIKSNYVVYLPENSANFYQMPSGFFVEAVDADEPGTANSNVTYELEGDSYGLNYFHINSRTGQIFPLPPGVDLESMPGDYFNFTVTAQDQAPENPLSNSAIVLIYVNDTNDNAPIFAQSVYNVSLYENATAGSPVISTIATDADRSPFNSRVSYRIADVQDKFVIDSQTGEIFIADDVLLDRDITRKDYYKLTVIASDQGVPSQSAHAQVNIHIIDINDKLPKFTQEVYSVKVLEDVPVGTFLINLTAHDTDLDSQLVYQIVGYKDAQTDDGMKVDIAKYNFPDLFLINDKTGQVVTAGPLDRERLERVVFLVNVTDENGVVNLPQTTQTSLDILLLDINDNAPQFSKSLYTKSVLENAEIGSVIMTVSATDKDKNHTVTFSIDNPDNLTLVNIGPLTGEITVASIIDYEAIHWINFTIIATDSGVPPLSNTSFISLRVIDQNDNSPIFHPSSTYSTSLAEDSAPGTFLIRVNATDLDSGSFGKISYFLINDLESAPHFAINETTGVIRVAAPLDREIRPVYSLTVRAIDDYKGHVAPGSHESTAVIRVTLIDVNDNAPEFAPNTPKVVTITENNAAGALVMTIAATDKDDPTTGNGQVRFAIVDGNGSIHKGDKIIPLFTLDSVSGALRLVSNLTGFNGLYWLTVEASDLGKPTPLASRLNVTIKIQDYNDHKPVILTPKPQSIFYIPENNYSDFYAITKINAMDADEGVNAELSYAIKQTSTNEDWKYFRIDSISGNVYARQAFDYERQNRYELTGEACDYGQPRLCDEVEFSVSILDEDDNCPFFKRSRNFTHELEIKENEGVESIVGNILEATDKDTYPENVQICYDIFGGDKESFRMAVHNETTLLSMVSFDREKRNFYQLVIKATNCHEDSSCLNEANNEKDSTESASLSYQPDDSSLLLVHIKILDDNDNVPFFLQSSYRGGVHYDTKIGSRVARVRADDLDILDANRLIYFISTPIKANLQGSDTYDLHKPPFLVNETTGDITTNILFQPSWKGTFEIPVGVKDVADHSATVIVTIHLLRFDQQLELIFEAPVNQVWDEAHDIIKYLSAATSSNATIDDVLPYEFHGTTSVAADGASSHAGTVKVAQSKVLVHFVDEGQDILGIDSALQLLDRPKTVEQKQAKHHLISVHHLRYAGQNSDPSSLSILHKSDTQTLTALAGVVGGLVLVMSALIATWCIQTRTYKRKLKAAATLAFSTSDMIVPAYDLPGTNLHANSNPIWSPDGGHFPFESDQHSNTSARDSLDDNDLTYQLEKTAHESPRTASTGFAGSQFFGSSTNTAVEVLKRNSTTESKSTTIIIGHPESVNRNFGEHVDGDKTISAVTEERNYYKSNLRSGTASPQPPNFPKPLLSSLESTEL